MSRFEELHSESFDLVSYWEDVNYNSMPPYASAEFFSNFEVGGRGMASDDIFHFVYRACTVCSPTTSTVACVSFDDQDNVTYHKGGECPHRDYAIL